MLNTDTSRNYQAEMFQPVTIVEKKRIPAIDGVAFCIHTRNVSPLEFVYFSDIKRSQIKNEIRHFFSTDKCGICYAHPSP